MPEPLLSAAILLFALVLFVSERVRHDLVAVAALFACLLAGLVTPGEAFEGFADPAVIAVAAVLVVGRAVELSGAAAAATRALVPASAPFGLRLAAVLLVGATLSAFMNNIAALVITMPVAAQIAREARLPPGTVLMPLSYATILGGMTTLIGTPANLILSSLREDQLGAPFDFFAMTPVGVAVAGAGLLYLATVGRRLIPVRSVADREDLRPWRAFELVWNRSGSLSRADLLARLRRAGGRLLALFRNGVRLRWFDELRPGDRLLVIARANPWEIAKRADLDEVHPSDPGPDWVTARVVVAHGSLLVGLSHEAVWARSDEQLRVVAAGPRPARLRLPLSAIRIEPGDQLHIRGPAPVLSDFIKRARLLEVDRLDPLPVASRQAVASVAIFAGAIAAAVLGGAPIALSFLAAAALLAGLKLIPAGEVYRAIDWPIIVLLAAMIPVGRSFETSGAAAIAAGALGELLAGAPMFVALAAICAATLLLSIFLNNVATAIIMGPLAIDLAGILGVNADAALLAVLIGASSDFLTPIGHQNNLLVMGPGGYQFGDYARVGALLAVLVVVIAAGVLTALYA